MVFTLLPAVDIVGGQAVRLDKGVAGTEKVYGDPVEAAFKWQEAGATWLHLVDLDAAFGRGHNYGLTRRIVEAVDLNVELTGGIRDDASLERALATGATRLNIGTAALKKPEWIASVLDTYGERIAVDLAARLVDDEWRAAIHGWVDDGGDLWDVLERLDAQGCCRFVVTDVSRDGTLSGPNIDLLRDVSAATSAVVTASGGVSSINDLVNLAQYSDEGIDSAIVGKALYEGRIDFSEALAAVSS